MNNKFFFGFIFIVFCQIFTGLIFNFYIFNDRIYFNSFIDKLDSDQIERMITFNRKYSWVSLVLNPLLYLIKLFLISISIYFIKIIIGKAFNASFGQIFMGVTKADLIFLALALFRVVYFLSNPPDNLDDIQNFAPGSLFQFVSQVNEPWLVYPLQAISIWELGFVLFLAFQLKEYFQNDFALSLQNVLLSYGTVFLLWIVFVVFITLNLT